MNWVLPTLNTFRELPVVRSASSTESGHDSDSDTTDELNIPSDEKMLLGLREWSQQTEAEFARILNNEIDSPETTNNKPVYWPTAWFTCTLCASRRASDRAGRRNKPLTFEVACLHECPIRGRQKKHRSAQKWHAGMFIRNDNVRVFLLIC